MFVFVQVMLDMEQEEDLVRERIARRKKERERLQQYEKQLNAFIFGEDGRMHFFIKFI